MADPLSIATGVITIVGALKAVTKGYKVIVDLKNAPEEFKSLVDEMECLQSHIAMLGRVLDLASPLPAQMRDEVDRVVSRLHCKVGKLDSALKRVRKVSKETHHVNPGSQVSSRRWHTHKSRILQLQEQMRTGQQETDRLIIALSFSQTTQVLAKIDAIFGLSRPGHSASLATKGNLLSSVKSELAMAMSSSGSNQGCTELCPCKCHQLWTSHRALRRKLSSPLAVLPGWYGSYCSNPNCWKHTKRSLSIFSRFPWTQQLINARVDWGTLLGPWPSLSVSVARLVGDNEGQIIAARYGNLPRLQ
ncbi:hypothetical protein F5Y15DRAFT_300104 [Xylariaceae sp. FL0016]|nr:hypothetical protein F5Y15DRAFT_300104 [Xylariaceae sp. FL0016]